MAETAIDLVAQAIHDVLMATGQFKTGSPHVRKDIGAKPAFSVWWPGWEGGEDPAPTRGPTIVTHEFQLDVFSSISGDMGESDRRFRQLIQDALLALKENPRLNDTCLRSRVRRGVNDIDADGNNPFFVSSITIQVDRMTW